MQELKPLQIQNCEHTDDLIKKPRARYNKISKVILSDIQKKRFWTQAEDKILQMGVRKYGNKKWSQISKLLKNRHPKRCRERWFNFLTEKNKSWTNYDLWLLFLAFKIHGNKWSQISKIFERGDNVIKNKIICLKRKGLAEFQERLKQIEANQSLQTNLPSLEYSLEQRLLKILIETKRGPQDVVKKEQEEAQRTSGSENEYCDRVIRYSYEEIIERNAIAHYQIPYQYVSCSSGIMYYMMPFGMTSF